MKSAQMFKRKIYYFVKLKLLLIIFFGNNWTLYSNKKQTVTET